MCYKIIEFSTEFHDHAELPTTYNEYMLVYFTAKSKSKITKVNFYGKNFYTYYTNKAESGHRVRNFRVEDCKPWIRYDKLFVVVDTILHYTYASTIYFTYGLVHYKTYIYSMVLVFDKINRLPKEILCMIFGFFIQ